MKTQRVLGRAFLLLLPLAACDESSGPVADGPGVPNVPAPPSPSPSPGEAEPECTAPAKGPTIHKGDIAGDEVWRADESPHVLDYNVTIRNGRTLTIEPCAEVRMAKGANIQVAFPGTPNTGTLVAEGTAKRPIRFTGKDGARWSSVMVHAPGTARFAYTTFEGGGGDVQDGASLSVVGDGLDGADPLVFVDHVTIARSLGTGAWLQRGASFAAGSRDLTIEESGSYPIEIGEHAIDTFPSGSYTRNAKDEILIEQQGTQTAGVGLIADATMHERGVPYHFGRSQGSSLIVGGRVDRQLVTLTIEPGVVVRFEPRSALKVQHYVDDKPSTGALKAIGTADKPIVFTSTAGTAKAGDWRGLWFGGVPDPSNVVDHVRIENAGADCGCILATCSAIAEHEAAIIFTGQPAAAFVTNTTFANISGSGIVEGYMGAFVDFRPTNAFEGVTGCAQTRPGTNTCPSPRPACD